MEEENIKKKMKIASSWKQFFKNIFSSFFCQILFFFTQDEFIKNNSKKVHQTWPVILVKILKNIVQFTIGVGLFVLVGYKMLESMGATLDTYPFWEEFKPLYCKYDQIKLLEIVSIGLGAATAVELAYMLFTPGPDEAVQPVMMGIASFVLYALSLYNGDTNGLTLIGIAILALCIPVLFYTKEWMDSKSKNRS
ncbi:hypothetical protein [Ancylomarina longa]|uniref:Uncharacterized protein n=1 Tax=Ancylomarina longa TaxID=2487017 RepID=A0A434AEV9_9BACT|nr:hypothetical protein [Ancylomarina longa]RUT72931.1 hypothetical protein DLK05_15845 [Ancylomarina longa]